MGFIGFVHQLEAKVEGNYKMSFTNFTTGNSHSFGGEFVVLTPFEYIEYTDRFEYPKMPGEMTTTILLKKVLVGTELKITQEGIPAAIPIEMYNVGWQDSLEKLAK